MANKISYFGQSTCYVGLVGHIFCECGIRIDTDKAPVQIQGRMSSV